LYSLSSDLRKISRGGPIGLVAGGETIVRIGSRSGKGGRNQEVALSYACSMNRGSEVVGGFLGTDGRDGNSVAAGGIISNRILRRMKRPELLSYLKRHDSYSGLHRARSLLVTGPTGTNVGDVAVVLAYS
jgi:hydroxypyruvate reductase